MSDDRPLKTSLVVESLEELRDVLVPDPAANLSPVLVERLKEWQDGRLHDLDLAGGFVLKQNKGRLSLESREKVPALADMQRVVNNYGAAAGRPLRFLITQPFDPKYTLYAYVRHI